MTFSYAKRHTLAKKKELGLSTFFLALFIATAFFIPYIISGHGYFIFYGDFNVQQIPFYQLCHDAVRSGNFGWNWNTDLGSPFIPAYSFYTLGSPFFWLTIPFPNHFLPYLMGPLLILKFACAALTSYFFIRRFTRTPFSAQIGALLYAFSGFSIYNIFFNHFHEAIIVFPLLLLSLELLITENRRGIFALTVALCAVTNYFFFFGMAVFTVIYWFIRTISKAYKFRFSRFLILIIEAILGVGLSVFILLPSVMMITSNTRVNDILIGWGGIMYGKEQIYLNIIECFFFPPDIPARPIFFPGANVKWSSLGGWLPLFSMTAVFSFCSAKKGHWIKRVIATCTVMALVPILNSAFYAFNDSYYARWFYMPILIMALATAITLEDTDINWKKGFNTTALITAIIAVVIGLFPQKTDDGIVIGLYTDAGQNNFYTFRFLIAVGFAAISLLICRLLIMLRDMDKKMLFRRLATGFLSIIIVAYGCVYLYQGSSHSFDRESVMIDSLIEGEVNLEDEGNYRIDTYDCVDNTAMYLGYPSINAFHSVVSTSIMDYYDFIGVKRDVASRPAREYFSIRSLLSVKYLFNRESGDSFIGDDGYTVMPNYKYLDTQSGYYIYENKAYIPYGFSYDYYITKAQCEAYYSDESRADVMLKAIVLSDEDALKYGSLMESYSDYSENYEDPDKDEFFIPEETPESELLPDLITSGDELGPEYTESDFIETDPVIPDEYVLSLSMSEDELYKDALHLADSSATSFEVTKKGFNAVVEREQENLVFFSVPYDKGWTATVNGEEAEIVKANIGFMAVKVPAGVSEISFSYTTPYLYLGIFISAVSLVVLIIYIIISVICKRVRPAHECYPEGDALIEKWSEEEYEISLKEESEKEISLLDKMPEKVEVFNQNDINKYDSGFKIDTSAFENGENSVDNNDN